VLLAVSVNLSHRDPDRALYRGKMLQYVEHDLLEAVRRSGAFPVMLPTSADPQLLADAVGLCAGLVLSGGADVAPEGYGERPLRPEWSGDPARDAYEVAAVRAFLAAERPVLGVCRGAQLLNVALGGSLYQDLATQLPGALVHRDWAPYDANEHEVEVLPGSWVSACYGGATRLLVNSVHHQAVKEAAGSLRITARAADGVVEAVEHVGAGTFAVGVQWHPEWSSTPGPSGRARAPGDALFAAFAARCRGAGAA
jgi:putative glutamine amidotransferase